MLCTPVIVTSGNRRALCSGQPGLPSQTSKREGERRGEREGLSGESLKCWNKGKHYSFCKLKKNVQLQQREFKSLRKLIWNVEGFVEGHNPVLQLSPCVDVNQVRSCPTKYRPGQAHKQNPEILGCFGVIVTFWFHCHIFGCKSGL